MTGPGDALARMAWWSTVEDNAEQQRLDAERAERAARREDALLQQANADRVSRFRFGYSPRELQRFQADRERAKQERITELETELRRLKGIRDDEQPVARSRPTSWARDFEQALARHAELHEDDGVVFRAQIARHENALKTIGQNVVRTHRPAAEISR